MDSKKIAIIGVGSMGKAVTMVIAGALIAAELDRMGVLEALNYATART